jgi:hypothetical protein
MIREMVWMFGDKCVVMMESMIGVIGGRNVVRLRVKLCWYVYVAKVLERWLTGGFAEIVVGWMPLLWD